MAQKISKAIGIILQVLIPFILLLASTFLSKQLPLIAINKTLAVCEIVLFLTACFMNLFHFVRISLLICTPPLCLRQACKMLKWLTLMIAFITGGYVFLSTIWFFSYDNQQLIEVIDLLYNIIEIILAIFGIIFAFFANTFIKKQRSEPVSECQP